MDRSEEYRRMAASCLRLAGRVKDTAEKMILIEMARVWHGQIGKLETERQADIVCELSEQPQVAAQQQQQIQPKKTKSIEFGLCGPHHW